MEKFGIFELLDALAALTAPPQEQNAEDKDDKFDPAFFPPSYAKEEKKEEKDVPPPKMEQDALSAFYARHNSVAKKAKK